MGIFSGIVALLKAIPTFIGLFKEVLAIVHEVQDYFERQQKLKDLTSALNLARTQKDPTKLTEMFGGRPPLAESQGTAPQNQP